MVSVGHYRALLHDYQQFGTLQYQGHSHWLDYNAHTEGFDDHAWLLEASSTYLRRIVCRSVTIVLII